MAAVQLELWASPPSAKDLAPPTVSLPQKSKPKNKPNRKTKPRHQLQSGPLQRRDIWADLTANDPTNQAPLTGQTVRLVTHETSASDQAPDSTEERNVEDKKSALQRLRRQVSAMETGGKQDFGPRISCGIQELDRLLPGGGFAPGTLVEWVEQDVASGAGWLSLLATKAVLDARPDDAGRIVVIDTNATFYPLAAVAAGLPLERLLIVQPANLADGLWAADQALRNPAVAVVWGVLPVLDDRQARRLQLAAEVGQTMGLWLRPARALSEPSWADVRWFVRGLQQTDCLHADAQHASRYLETRLVRCRGGRSGTSVTLQIDSSGKVHHVLSKRQTAAVPLVAQLADPAAVASTAREQQGEQQAKRRPA